MTSSKTSTKNTVFAVIGVLVFLEFASGILQGYYSPIYTDIARHLGIHDADVNWFEGAELAISVVCVPVMAKLGDMVGHRRILLIAIALTCIACFGLCASNSFAMFLFFKALHGFNNVWLPMEVAIVFARSHNLADQTSITRRASGFLVGALEAGVIIGALSSGLIADAAGENFWILMLMPAVAVTIAFIVVFVGVKKGDDIISGGHFDLGGAVSLTISMLIFTFGLSLLRINGVGSWFSWVAVAAGIILFVPFVRQEIAVEKRLEASVTTGVSSVNTMLSDSMASDRTVAEGTVPDRTVPQKPSHATVPLISFSLMRSGGMWPIVLTACFFGMSVLGAQIPLSTFARTDPSIYGYGLGTSAFGASLLVGLYVISLLVGALLYPRLARQFSNRSVMIASAVVVGCGYSALIGLHRSIVQVVVCMMVAGIGSGALVAALPPAAASMAPASHTSEATGMTNGIKTLGGSVASCIYGIALMSGTTATGADGVEHTAGSLSGYMLVWAICGLSGFLCAALLWKLPKSQAAQDLTAQERAPQKLTA
ncbi:MAG: MFS transporter [Bifidobacteriaceae bacterium]|jgi:MFS family permease|nr:MFS transporter [Bifidobacteriaceae bacterium]MCI1978674.1 MFS transporter [Bifidobacteriaceae bacterium]